MKLREGWDIYYNAKLKNRKWKQTDEGRWKNHIIDFFGNEKKIEEINKYEIVLFSNLLEQKQLSPQTICHILKLLGTVINNLSDWGFYDGQKIKISKPKFDNRALRFFTPDEIDPLFNELANRSEFIHDFSLLALHTGCRAGELFKLNKSNVDLNKKCAYIQETKTSSNRVIPLNVIALEICCKYHQKRKFKFFSNPNKNDVDYVPPVFRRTINKLGMNDGVSSNIHKARFHTLSPNFSSGGKLRPKIKKSRINRFLDATYFDNEVLKRDICLSG